MKLKYEISEDEYVSLSPDLQAQYVPIHENETPTLERCFRLKHSQHEVTS